MSAFDLVNYSIWDSSLERNDLDSKVAVAAVVVGSEMKLVQELVKRTFLVDDVKIGLINKLTGIELLIGAGCCCDCQGIDDAGFDQTG